MHKIGITGSIGSGKSTVAHLFEVLGIPVYNADNRAKWLMNHLPDLIRAITELFGEEAYSDNMLNRPFIAAQVFQNPDKLRQLNAIVHPAVFNDFEQWCSEQTTPYVIKEAALMFESKSHEQLDEVIVVTAPENLRIQRAMQRDHATEASVRARMNNQLPESEKRTRSQYEIVNDDQHALIPQVLNLHLHFLKKAIVA